MRSFTSQLTKEDKVLCDGNDKNKMLGSKDLGFYVFRTLMCIVGKP